MSKKLLSTLVASLFAAAPASGQSADDPMRVQGTTPGCTATAETLSELQRALCSAVSISKASLACR